MENMKNFHDYYFGLTNAQRDTFVGKSNTTIGYAERVAGGFAKPSFEKLQRFIKASGHKVNFDSFVRTYEKRNGPLA